MKIRVEEWWEVYLDPTSIRGILFMSFIFYLISLAYQMYVVPHFEGYVDLQEGVRKRIIEARDERERKEKQAREQLFGPSKPKEVKQRIVEEEEENQEDEIIQEEAEEEESEAQQEKKKKKKNKKKANKEAGKVKVE